MIGAIALLLVCQLTGEVIHRLTGLPLPGSVIGMVLLLGALRWQAVQVRVQTVASFLLGHLSLLFVPVGVGVITQFGLVAEHGLRLLVVIVVSTWVGLAVTAVVLRRLMKSTAP